MAAATEEMAEANSLSAGRYKALYAARARKMDAISVEKWSERSARNRTRLKRAGQLAMGVKNMESVSHVKAVKEAVWTFEYSRRTAPIQPSTVPMPTLKADVGRRSLYCELCGESTLLGARTSCAYCPVVAHERCLTVRNLDWTDLLGFERSCCHMCKADLDEKKRDREQHLNRLREEQREYIASQVIKDIVRSYVTKKHFTEMRRRVVLTQTAARRMTCRNAFVAHRAAVKRVLLLSPIDLKLTASDAFPDATAIVSYVTVFDASHRCLLHCRKPQVPLVALKPPRHLAHRTEDSRALKALVRRSSIKADQPAPHRRRKPSAAAVESRAHLSSADNPHLLAGFPLNLTIVFTILVRTRAGYDGNLHVDQLLGQGTYHIKGTLDDFRAFVTTRGDASTVSLSVLGQMRYPLADMSRDEMNDMNASLIFSPLVTKATVTFSLAAKNSLTHLAAWLDGPHYDILKKPKEGLGAPTVTKGGRSQNWWATLLDPGTLALYTHPTDKQPRVALPTSKVAAVELVVPKAGKKAKRSFCLVFADRRRFLFAPATENEVSTWIAALTYWRLRGTGVAHADAFGRAFREPSEVPPR